MVAQNGSEGDLYAVVSLREALVAYNHFRIFLAT
jgi:hypothetical protein